MCVIFNVTVALLWLTVPNACSKMLPGEIRKAALKRTKQEVMILAGVLYPLWFGIIAYFIVSSYLAGVTGFWNLFWTAYIEMFLSIWGTSLALTGFLERNLRTAP